MCPSLDLMLDVRGCGLTDACAVPIALWLLAQPLRCLGLHLAMNAFTDAAAGVLVNATAHIPHLTLDLRSTVLDVFVHRP